MCYHGHTSRRVWQDVMCNDAIIVKKLSEIQTLQWRHQMEAFSVLLVFCAGNSPVTGEFPSQRPETRSFDVFLDLRLDKLLSKQSRRRWFVTPSHSLWRHFNEANVCWTKYVFSYAPDEVLTASVLRFIKIVYYLKQVLHTFWIHRLLE